MNVKKKNSEVKIEKAFINLLQTLELNEIRVTDICLKANINRSTFYANYLDIYDLADKVKKTMYLDILGLYKEETLKQEHSYNYLKLFKHIKKNQEYYKIMFKLNFDFSVYYDYYLEQKEAMKYFSTNENLDYHITFFKAGISAVLKKWLNNNCDKEPEEMAKILFDEYQKKQK